MTDGEAVVLHADTSAYFGLNRVGTAIWVRLTEGPRTVPELAAWSRRTFTAVPDSLDEEIATFVEQLRDGELLVAEDATDSPLEPEEALAAGASPWETPLAECFGQLEKLILSGE
jgi:hypothetical protein